MTDRIGNDLNQAYNEGYDQGQWDMFNRISKAFFGEEKYQLSITDKNSVYSPIGTILTREEAYTDFCEFLHDYNHLRKHFCK